MKGHRALRRFKELRSRKSRAAQLSMLTGTEQRFLQTVAFNPGYKLNGGEANDECAAPMWPLLEDLGLIECVGGYKWKATPKGQKVMVLLARRLA